MFLKIMQYKMPAKKGKILVPKRDEKYYFSTNMIDCKKVTFYEDEFEGINFTIFTTDSGRESERTIRINEEDYDLNNVYIMNDDGKTIQKPM